MKHPDTLENPAEDQAPGDNNSFADILSQFEQEHAEPKPGETITGTVVAVTPEAVFVDIGRKTEGMLPPAGLSNVKPGDTILVAVTGRGPEGYYQLSTVRVERPKDWGALEAAFAEHRTIAGVVTEPVKGGLRVDIGVPAFMPASRSGIRELADLPTLVGQEIQCRITKLDVASEDVVVDRRVVLEEEAKRAKQAALDAIGEGTVVRGTVRSLTDFGAFVDIGGVDGLLHVADISWNRIGKPADVLKAGDSIEVKVLKVNRETRKISLGMKQLVPDPWSIAAEKYKSGARVKGTVARLTDFGAFITLEPGIDGLVHVSELSWDKKVRRPADILKTGESVEVVVLGANAAEHRISLGLKQALGDPWEEAEQKYPVGSPVEGVITNMANFGAFVDLGGGIEGMIHVGDITREKRLDHPKEMLKSGQAVRAQVLELDRERRRIRLGMKQLEPTSADHFIAQHQVGEVITGRVAEVKGDRARVELAEGVHGTCRLKTEESGKPGSSGRDRADISALTAQLAAKWKQGGGESESQRNQLKTGQIRNFKIVALDAAQKKIALDLAADTPRV